MNEGIKVHNLKTLYFGNSYCLIPEFEPKELEKDLLTAFAKNALRLKSLDYTKKKYINSLALNKRNPGDKLLSNIANEVWNQSEELFDYLKSINFKQESISSIAIDSTLNRLENSYESALFLIKNRFYFESFSIIRLIFEQLVFCINICDMNNDTYNSIKTKRGKTELDTTNINKIKKLFPELKLGHLYRHLSAVTHIGFTQAHKFVKFDKEIGVMMTISKSYEQSIEAAMCLLKVSDIHSFVFEYSLRNHIENELKYIKIDGQKISINPKRKLKEVNIKLKYKINEFWKIENKG